MEKRLEKDLNNKVKNEFTEKPNTKEKVLKRVIATLAVINILIVLSIILGSIDKSRLENDKNPIFSFKIGTYLDGGTQEYLGLGYKIIKYPRSRMDIVDIGTWFLQYKDGYAPGPLQDITGIDVEINDENIDGTNIVDNTDTKTNHETTENSVKEVINIMSN